MRVAVIAIVSMSLVIPPAPLPQERAAGRPAVATTGPTRASARVERAVYEALRFLAGAHVDSGKSQAKVDWSRVRRIEPGEKIKVVPRTGDSFIGRFVLADERTLLVLVPRPDVEGADKGVAAVIEEVKAGGLWEKPDSDWNHAFPGKGRLTSAGVFSPAGVKLADLKSVANADVVGVAHGRRAMGATSPLKPKERSWTSRNWPWLLVLGGSAIVAAIAGVMSTVR